MNDEDHAIGALVGAAEVNIESKIKWSLKIDLCGVPYASVLKLLGLSEGVTVAVVLGCVAVEYVSVRLRECLNLQEEKCGEMETQQSYKLWVMGYECLRCF